MRRLAGSRQLTAWIAILAVLVMSLAPTVSHALRHASGEGWIEVCTAEGSRQVRADPVDAGGALATVDHLFDHCPCCSSLASTLGLPPAADSAALGLVVHDEVPRAFLVAPRTLFAWLRVQPRAPPRLP